MVRVPLLLVTMIWLAVPCKVTAPLIAFKESTAPPAPPPPVVQVVQVRLPLASMANGPEALTATVPLAFGNVMVLLEPLGVPKFRVLVKAPLVLEIATAAPCTVTFCAVTPNNKAAVGAIVLTAKVPLTVTVLPDSANSESPKLWLEVNLAKRPVVPPAVVTPEPEPAQLPTVVQML